MKSRLRTFHSISTSFFIFLFSFVLGLEGSQQSGTMGNGFSGGFSNNNSANNSGTMNGGFSGGFNNNNPANNSGTMGGGFSGGFINGKTPQQTNTQQNNTNQGGPQAPGGQGEGTGDTQTAPVVSLYQNLPPDLVETANIITGPKVPTIQKITAAYKRFTDPSTPAEELEKNPVTAGAIQVTHENKHSLPSGIALPAKASLFNFTSRFQKAATFSPSQGITSNSNLNNLYQTFIESVEATPTSLSLFRKLHIIALHQIYGYLMGIYTALNLTHIDDLETYITLESIYGFNKKTLIINHLINIIEAQLNQSLRALFPGAAQYGPDKKTVTGYNPLPQQTVNQFGVSCIKTDNYSMLDLYIIDMEQTVFASFEKAGIYPNEWGSVVDALLNPDYQRYLPQESIVAIADKISKFLNYKMDLGGTSSYIKDVRATYAEPPQSTYWNGAIPSAIAWETKVNELLSQTDDDSKIPGYVSLLKQLTQEEQSLLIDALDILIAHFSNEQLKADTTSLINILKGKSSGELTHGEYTLLVDFVRNVTFFGPIDQIINTIHDLYPALLFNSSTPLTQTEIDTLKGIVSYSLLRFENGSAQGLNLQTSIVQQKLHQYFSTIAKPTAEDAKLEKLFETLSGLTALQQGMLKVYAQELLKNSDVLSRIGKESLQNLANGFSFLASQKSEYGATTQLFSEISTILTSPGQVSTESFSSPQLAAYKQGLHKFASYKPEIYSNKAALQDLYTLFPQKESDGTYVIDNVTASLNAQDADTFSKKTPLELLMILGSFQSLGRVFESRISQNIQDGATLASIFEPEQNLKNELYTQISYSQYSNLTGIYRTLQQAKSFKFSDLSKEKLQALRDTVGIFVLPKDTKGLNSKGFLEVIQAIHMQDTTAQKVASNLTKADDLTLQKIFQLVQNPAFKITDLSSSQKSFLAILMSKYQTEIESMPDEALTKTPVSQTPSKTTTPPKHPLSETNQIDINGVLSVLKSYNTVSQMQKDYLGVLGQYLNFFCSYTATLNNGAQNVTATSNTPYLGLTEFSEYAQSLATKVATAKFPDGTPMHIAQMNPPLFFYNQETLRGISLIPQLAKEIEGTLNSPYPTFGIDAALSTSPTSSDPKESNLVIVEGDVVVTIPSLTISSQGTTISPKFFFKDEFGNPFANTSDLSFGKYTAPKGKAFQQQVFKNKNPKLAWLEKIIVPTQNPTTNYSYIYAPATDSEGNLIQPKGEEGFYMNIPMTLPGPLSENEVSLRFYEQKILPQPNWLNSEQGVITMLRICLGDFASALTMGEPIFDSCLQLILREALATLPQPPSNLPNPQSLSLSDAEKTSLSQSCRLSLVKNYMDEKELQKYSEEIALG